MMEPEWPANRPDGRPNGPARRAARLVEEGHGVSEVQGR
jgi:hypothetical protein